VCLCACVYNYYHGDNALVCHTAYFTVQVLCHSPADNSRHTSADNKEKYKICMHYLTHIRYNIITMGGAIIFFSGEEEPKMFLLIALKYSGYKNNIFLVIIL
jgi:hypothetical protein